MIEQENRQCCFQAPTGSGELAAYVDVRRDARRPKLFRVVRIQEMVLEQIRDLASSVLKTSYPVKTGTGSPEGGGMAARCVGDHDRTSCASGSVEWILQPGKNPRPTKNP